MKNVRNDYWIRFDRWDYDAKKVFVKVMKQYMEEDIKKGEDGGERL